MASDAIGASLLDLEAGAGAVSAPPSFSGSSVAIVWRPLTSISWRSVPSIGLADAVRLIAATVSCVAEAAFRENPTRPAW